MKNKKIVTLFFSVLLIIFTLGLVQKQFQDGDTFWYISIGDYIVNTNSIDGLDHWTFHENLKYPYQRIFVLSNFLLYVFVYGIYRHIHNCFSCIVFDFNSII